MSKKRLAIFASGKGSNALNIINHLRGNAQIEVAFILSNKKDAPILEHAQAAGVKTYFFDNNQTADGAFLSSFCKGQHIDFIILAGFLLQFPTCIIKEFPNIINIHPALLPKYGGKGMYGMNVHRAVLENKEVETGITIHFVTENYDEGEIVFQKTVSVENCSSAEEVADKIHKLEQDNFPQVIEQLLQKILFYMECQPFPSPRHNRPDLDFLWQHHLYICELGRTLN